MAVFIGAAMLFDCVFFRAGIGFTYNMFPVKLEIQHIEASLTHKTDNKKLEDIYNTKENKPDEKVGFITSSLGNASFISCLGRKGLLIHENEEGGLYPFKNQNS